MGLVLPNFLHLLTVLKTQTVFCIHPGVKFIANKVENGVTGSKYLSK